MVKKERKKFSLDVPKKLDSPEFQAFVEGAKTRSNPKLPPWSGLNPEAKPSKQISLRLNDYEWELLQFVSKKEQRSFQSTIRVILTPILNEKANCLFWSE